jgi:hypothetical protein
MKMILIHKETAEIYEVRIKTLDAGCSIEEFPMQEKLEAYPIGEISLFGGDVIHGMSYDAFCEKFEILGWL